MDKETPYRTWFLITFGALLISIVFGPLIGIYLESKISLTTKLLKNYYCDACYYNEGYNEINFQYKRDTQEIKKPINLDFSKKSLDDTNAIINNNLNVDSHEVKFKEIYLETDPLDNTDFNSNKNDGFNPSNEIHLDSIPYEQKIKAIYLDSESLDDTYVNKNNNINNEENSSNRVSLQSSPYKVKFKEIYLETDPLDSTEVHNNYNNNKKFY